MRHLSLAIIIALLFSHFVVALPGRARKGGAPQHKPSSKPSVKSQVIGKNHPSGGGKAPKVLKTPGQIKVGDVVGVKVKEHEPHVTDPRIREKSHGAVVVGRTGQTLHLAPITNHPPSHHNPGDYDQANKYVKGVQHKSQVYIGKPYQVHENNVNPSGFSGFKVHDFQGLKDKVDAKNHNGPISTPSGSGSQHGGGAGSQPKTSPPNNSAFRQRTAAPPNQPKHGHLS